MKTNLFRLILIICEIKIEPILVATKVTGSQVVEVAVMAYVLSTRSGIQKSLRLQCLMRNQSHDNNPSIGQFFNS